MRKRGFLTRLFVLRVMKFKSDAFRNHMAYVNLKNSNMKKMPYSTRGLSMQMSTQKLSRWGENCFGHIKNNHTVLLCTKTRRKQKIWSCVLFVLLQHVLPWRWFHLPELTAHCVHSIYTTNFITWKGRVALSFNIKKSSPIFINFDRMYL